MTNVIFRQIIPTMNTNNNLQFSEQINIAYCHSHLLSLKQQIMPTMYKVNINKHVGIIHQTDVLVSRNLRTISEIMLIRENKKITAMIVLGNPLKPGVFTKAPLKILTISMIRKRGM